MLPIIEGTVYRPIWVRYWTDLTPTAIGGWYLGYQRDLAVLENAAEDLWDNPNLWLPKGFSTTSEVSIDVDLRGFDLLIGGPQQFGRVNTSGGARSYGCTMWFEDVKVSKQDWVAIISRTSYEAAA